MELVRGHAAPGTDPGGAVRRRRAEGADGVLRRRPSFARLHRSEGGRRARVCRRRERVDVTLRMRRGPHYAVAFAGDALPASRKDELSVIQREGTIDEDMLENEQVSLENELRAEGYRDAEVRYDREARGPDQVQVVFKIHRGPQYRVARIEITGNEHLSSAALQPSIRLRPGPVVRRIPPRGGRDTIAERYRRDGFASGQGGTAVTPGPFCGDARRPPGGHRRAAHARGVGGVRRQLGADRGRAARRRPDPRR